MLFSNISCQRGEIQVFVWKSSVALNLWLVTLYTNPHIKEGRGERRRHRTGPTSRHHKRGEGTVDWDTVASNCSTGNLLSNFNKRISSKSSNWTIWARWGFPTVSPPLTTSAAQGSQSEARTAGALRSNACCSIPRYCYCCSTPYHILASLFKSQGPWSISSLPVIIKEQQQATVFTCVYIYIYIMCIHIHIYIYIYIYTHIMFKTPRKHPPPTAWQAGAAGAWGGRKTSDDF